MATSNFPDAVDSAFTSRCDLFLRVPLPNRAACAHILRDCLTGLGQTYSSISALASQPGFDRCTGECVGLDGRAIRKMVANALASRPEVAMDPSKVTLDDIYRAAQQAKLNRGSGVSAK